jgi:hypothetical protein
VLLEKLQRPTPGEIGGFLVVAGGVGVVVQGVVGAFIDVDLVVLARGFQRFFIGRDAGIDVGVEAAVLQQQQR